MKKALLIIIAIFGLAVAALAIIPTPEACRSCSGRGWNKCNMCDGHGWRKCSSCDGKGYIVMRNGDRETCANCGGKKGFVCGYCDEGRRECSACYGTGKQRYI